MSKHVLRHDGARPTTVRSPKYGDVIVYNDNYFCETFNTITRSEERDE